MIGFISVHSVDLSARFRKQVQCTIVHSRDAYFKRYSAYQSSRNLCPKELPLVASPRSNNFSERRRHSFGKIRIMIYEYYRYSNNKWN